MDPQQQDENAPAPVPEDARETSPGQRVEEERWERRDGDPDAPGGWQSNDQIAEETTR